MKIAKTRCGSSRTIVALTSLSGLLIACGVPTSGPDTGRCRVKFARPYRPVITTQAIIRGEASARCLQDVDTHRVSLALELKSGRSWLVRDSEATAEIPYPNAVRLLVLTDCRPGTWRLRYSFRAAVHGAKATGTDASDELVVSGDEDCAKAR